MDDGHGGSAIRSVDRALVLLDLLARSAPQPLRVVDVAEQLAVTAATASRLLATLSARGYASQLPDRRFTVGPNSLELAVNWIRPLRSAVAPSVARLAEATGEAVSVSMLLGTVVINVGTTVPPRHPLRRSRVARTSPWATAAGRALVLGLPDKHRERVLADAPGEASGWMDEFHRERGTVYLEHGEDDCAMSCFARPVVTRDGQILSVAVMADGNRTHRPSRDDIRHHLSVEATRLTASG